MHAISTDDIFKCIILSENDRIFKFHWFYYRSPIYNKPTWVQVMAWRRIGDKYITWTNDGPVQWRIYAALGGDESTNNKFHHKQNYHQITRHLGITIIRITRPLRCFIFIMLIWTASCNIFILYDEKTCFRWCRKLYIDYL